MNLLHSYTALRTGCTPGKTLNCLAHSMHVSALRSRRSLRSLARCARLAMLNVLSHLEHLQPFCTVSKRLKTILDHVGVALAQSCLSGRLLRPSWRHLGTFWCLLGPSCRLLGESWRHLAPSWRHLGQSWRLLSPS